MPRMSNVYEVNMPTIRDRDGLVHFTKEADPPLLLWAKLAKNLPAYFAVHALCGVRVPLQGAFDETATCMACLIARDV